MRGMSGERSLNPKLSEARALRMQEGRIWVMEKSGGEPAGVERQPTWAGAVAEASPWRQHLEAPLELLTEARVHTYVHPGPRAHTCTLEPTQSQHISEAIND